MCATSVINAMTSNCKKPHRAEQWEINIMGDFLLDLYLKQIISSRTDWLINKQRLRDEFSTYLRGLPADLRQKLFQANGTYCIGTLLSRTRYLRNMPPKCRDFRINFRNLLEFRNQKLHEYDERQKNGEFITHKCEKHKRNCSTDGPSKLLPDCMTTDRRHQIDPTLKECFEVDESAESHILHYQGTKIQQQRDPSCNDSFVLTNMGCYICQVNFESPDQFEEHVGYHSEETDFESLKDFQQNVKSVLKLSYQVCKNSHYFCFVMEAMDHDLVIDKIIIIQSRSMFYVNNFQGSHELAYGAKETFFVDSHLFTIHIEQPIVVVFHKKSSSSHTRIIEQHHFLRSEEFPVIKFNINPNHLPSSKTFKPKFRLPLYCPPSEIREALKKDNIVSSLSSLSNEFNNYVKNKKTLTIFNMREVLQMLLQVEDTEIMDKYNALVQRRVSLRQIDGQYLLRLAAIENTFADRMIAPSDDVIIIPEKDIESEAALARILEAEITGICTNEFEKKRKNKLRKYTGIVESFNDYRVIFKSTQRIPIHETFLVYFRPSRFCIRYQYRALENLNLTEFRRFLFPETPTVPNELSNANLVLVNDSIQYNPEQLQAVRNIAEGPTPRAPYVIFGPPGTGKTATVVEAILQLYLRRTNTKILVTAGSNSACDEIALRLCRFLESLGEFRAIVRVYSRTNEKRADNINEILIEASNMYSGHFYPDVEVLHKYRIVVCTLSVIGKLAMGKFGKNPDGSGVFTHLFIDEVAASTITESLIGVTNVLTPKSCLILSGDHKQLGPVLQSFRAKDLGLDVSLMEFLLKQSCYSVDNQWNYDRSIQTRLLRNYRSHPQIVQLYSGMYYGNKLIPDINSDKLCEKWHKAPNPNYPILFHSVFGCAAKDQQRLSLSNLAEVEAVMNYVKDLMYFGLNGQKIAQSDIGIISPYKRQYLRIQEELNLRRWPQIETGSVETFQGKEKKIIIISFVRSFTTTLGFLDDPKRTNVMLSRPKSLLILIGNPKTLSLNKDFKFIINECRRNNTLVGAPIYDEKDMKCSSLSMNNARSKSKLTSFQQKATNSSGNLELFNSTFKTINTNARNSGMEDDKELMMKLRKFDIKQSPPTKLLVSKDSTDCRSLIKITNVNTAITSKSVSTNLNTGVTTITATNTSHNSDQKTIKTTKPLPIPNNIVITSFGTSGRLKTNNFAVAPTPNKVSHSLDKKSSGPSPAKATKQAQVSNNIPVTSYAHSSHFGQCSSNSFPSSTYKYSTPYRGNEIYIHSPLNTNYGSSPSLGSRKKKPSKCEIL